MSLKEPSSGKHIVIFLGLGILILVAVGVTRLSKGSRASPEAEGTTSSQLSALDLTSPLPTVPFSPVQADVASPLSPTRVLQDASLPSTIGVPQSLLPPTPTTTLPLPDAGENADIQLTILHTNDTWGYLLPCG
jgi:hypothetical protein